MTPISLGIFASANTTVGTSFESIATVTVGSGGAADVEFTSIPGTYSHLQIRALLRTNRSNAGDAVYVRMNSDTGSNYSSHRIEGNGSAASAQMDYSATSIALNRVAAANDGANTFGATSIDILDYANTNKYKTLRALVGYDNNGSGMISLCSGLWQSTSAITSLKIIPLNATGFVQYSSFALYGIKGGNS